MTNARSPQSPISAGEIEAVQSIVASNGGAVPFNFCVSNHSAVTF